METVIHHRPYVGFWNRTAAALIDSLLLLLITLPIQQALSGRALLSLSQSPLGFWDVMAGYVLPAVAILVFWKYRSATPGKMFMSAQIVDAATGGKASTRQLVLRYVGYYLATIPLVLGFIWVAVDARKQGWHDKLAGTLVVSTKSTPDQGPATQARYAPTSPWTYALCVPVLVLILVLLLVAVAIALVPAGFRPGVAALN